VTVTVFNEPFEHIPEREFEKTAWSPTNTGPVQIDLFRRLNISQQPFRINQKRFDNLLTNGLVNKIVSFGRFARAGVGSGGFPDNTPSFKCVNSFL